MQDLEHADLTRRLNNPPSTVSPYNFTEGAKDDGTWDTGLGAKAPYRDLFTRVTRRESIDDDDYMHDDRFERRRLRRYSSCDFGYDTNQTTRYDSLSLQDDHPTAATAQVLQQHDTTSHPSKTINPTANRAQTIPQHDSQTSKPKSAI